MAATIWLQIIRRCSVTRKHKPFGASILISQSFLYLVSNSKPAIQWVAGLLVLINQRRWKMLTTAYVVRSVEMFAIFEWIVTNNRYDLIPHDYYCSNRIVWGN